MRSLSHHNPASSPYSGGTTRSLLRIYDDLDDPTLDDYDVKDWFPKDGSHE
jgi:hypothetical protein